MGYQHICDTMHVLEKTFKHKGVVKTIAIFGTVTWEDNFTLKNISMVTSNSKIDRHAEDLILANIDNEDKEDHVFFYVNRIPCYSCIKKILNTKFKKITLIIPANINVNSKWFKQQCKTIRLLKHIEYNKSLNLNKKEIKKGSILDRIIEYQPEDASITALTRFVRVIRL